MTIPTLSSLLRLRFLMVYTARSLKLLLAVLALLALLLPVLLSLLVLYVFIFFVFLVFSPIYALSSATLVLEKLVKFLLLLRRRPLRPAVRPTWFLTPRCYSTFLSSES